MTSSASSPGPRWLDDDEQRAWRAYIGGSQRLLEVLNRELVSSHGLSFADYRILVLLTEAPGGSLRMSELAEGLVSSRSRLTHQIRRMEADGLVRRENCESDGRGVLAVLTDAGHARLAEIAPTHVAGVRTHLVDLLDDADRAALERIFSRVDAGLVGQTRTRY
ncbi:MarR family transcriptional regulator [Rhodococcus aerolatus]